MSVVTFDRLVRVRCPGGPADRSVTRHEASHTPSQTSPSRHRTHPPEPEPGPSGPFDVTPPWKPHCREPKEASIGCEHQTPAPSSVPQTRRHWQHKRALLRVREGAERR